MKSLYKTHDTCSVYIGVELEDETIRRVEFMGGCEGNLKALSKLLPGMLVGEAVEKLQGITCGGKPTSCPDQLTRALLETREKAKRKREEKKSMIVVAATQNKHKIKEIDAITSRFGFEIKSLEDVGLGHIDVIEDGDTFEANSYKKASEICRLSGLAAIADDSGLMVDALDGAPGVYSARFAGEGASDSQNNEKLLEQMVKVPYECRGGKFVSVITMVFPDGETLVARGECFGRILREPQGAGGFGYDPLFLPEGYSQTFGELHPEMKNQISHRAKALLALKEKLDEKGGR